MTKFKLLLSPNLVLKPTNAIVDTLCVYRTKYILCALGCIGRQVLAISVTGEVAYVGRWNKIRSGLGVSSRPRVRRSAPALILSPVLCSSNPAHDVVETDILLARGLGGLTQADVQ